ncbi:MAG: carbohydrate-binding protein [Rhodoplanes sp.]
MSTTKITWAWGTNTVVSFNPAADVLDFGWFQADQFTISEVAGQVVIAIPSNHQTYTLQNISLQDLHLSNITAKDQSAISKWTAALNSASPPVTPPPDPPSDTSPPVTPPVTPPPADTGTWSATAVYTEGMTVVVGGVTYKANWWVQGVDPVERNGITGSGEPWTIIAGGSNDPTAWSTTKVYTAGMQAIVDGVIYEAKWWTKGDDPQFNNTIGRPWSVVGPADPADAVPTVPTGLTATDASSDAVMLTWNASTVPGGAAVTGYAIFLNGQQIGTTAGTSYTFANLTADTIYQFSVSALDAAGSSGQSGSISVHTLALNPDDPGSGGSGGGSTVGREFSPYIDMAIPSDADLMAISRASGIENFTLAFMLSSDQGIGWQGSGSIVDDGLANGSTILAQVQAVQAAGGHITISFGGAAGQEAALTATSATALQAEYQSVIDRYHVDSLDFDIEGWAVTDQRSIDLRNQALVGLQQANPDVTISFTLPVLPTGLVDSGLNLLRSATQAGMRVDVVNIMTMDYGTAVDNNGQMGLNAINAIKATEAQLAELGMTTTNIGVTPMIGVNDIVSEVFTLADARMLEDYAETDPNVVRLSMWSVARDNGNGAGAPYASPFNGGIAQELYDFAEIFGEFDPVGAASTTAALSSGSGASAASGALLGQYAAGGFASPMGEITGAVQTSALEGSEQTTLVQPQPA